jgi:hypothetical protein
MRRRAHAGAGAAALLALTPCAAAAAEPVPPQWQLQVGHSYSSVNALRQPATFVFSADLGRPTLTKIDAGLLIAGPWADNGGFDFGVRASAGSVRTRPQRAFGSLLRGWKHWDPIAVAASGEYEADGGFDLQKGVLAAEITPLGGLPGLGVWLRPAVRLRWRPWIGLGYGNVFDARDGSEGVEAGGFWRGLARLELSFEPGGASRAAPDRDRARLDLEATGWLLFDDTSGEGYVKAALSVPLGEGLSMAASAEAGRQPPSFVLARRIGLGFGFSY